jgi:Domain of unknown function (DUF397)
MSEPYNGMPATGLGDINWLKSRHSNPSGNCVEIACLPDGEIAVRNSRFPGGPVLLYTQAEVAAFLAGAKDGEFDGMVAGLSSGSAGGLVCGGADRSDPENRGDRRVTAIAPGGPN